MGATPAMRPAALAFPEAMLQAPASRAHDTPPQVHGGGASCILRSGSEDAAMSPPAAIGLDFGTTNSAIARAAPGHVPELASFASVEGPLATFRSVLYFDREDGSGPVSSHAGPAAIERYLDSEEKAGRLIQSLKSFLASRLFRSTAIFGRSYRLEDLVTMLLRALREEAEAHLGIAVERAVVGRPVHFVRAADEDDESLALARLGAALRSAGFREVRFEYEPVGAAYHFESTLDRDALILIGDFGGGTSDFSLLRVGPAIAGRGRQPGDLLGNEGLGLAGDAFDARIIRNLVSPALGAGSSMRSMDKVLPVPTWVYMKLERWHHLSFLKSREVMNMLRSVRAQAFEPRKIEALLHLIQQDLGYRLHKAVQEVKCRLSVAENAVFRFLDADVHIETEVARRDFENWISVELTAIEKSVDSLLSTAGVQPRDVDMVFLTGGSSFVPAVRRIFETRFGPERIRSGNEFTSVARGLALKSAALRLPGAGSLK